MLEVEDDENTVLEEKGVHSSHDDHKEKKDNPPSIPIQDLSSPLDKRFVPKAPFPQSLISPQKSAQFGDILEVFKQGPSFPWDGSFVACDTFLRMRSLMLKLLTLTFLL